MAVICEHCKNPIESRDDLVVMRQWCFIPRALHKKCWGDIAMTHGGASSISYGTGIFRDRQQPLIAINSIAFTIIAIIFMLIGLYVFLFADLSTATISVSGTVRALTANETMVFRAIILVVFFAPLLVRLWVYNSIENKLPAVPAT